MMYGGQKMKKIYAVTGYLGFLGNSIIENLLSKEVEIRALDIHENNSKYKESENITFYKGDICDPLSMKDFFTTNENEELIVIHAAGIVSITSKYNEAVRKVNVEGTQNIVDMCLEHKVKKLVYVSTVHAIPELKKGETIIESLVFDPDKIEGEYGKTKALATMAVLEGANKGLFAVVVHPSGIIGPGDFAGGHTTQIVKDCVDGRLTATVSGGYDFVDVRDVAEGIYLASEKGVSGETYILSGEYYPIKLITDTVCEVTKTKKIKTVLPLWIAKLTAPLAELYYRIRKQKPLYTKYSLYTLQSNAKFSSKKAERELGYTKKYSLKQSIIDTYHWGKANRIFKTTAKNKV